MVPLLHGCVAARRSAAPRRPATLVGEDRRAAARHGRRPERSSSRSATAIGEKQPQRPRQRDDLQPAWCCSPARRRTRRRKADIEKHRARRRERARRLQRAGRSVRPQLRSPPARNDACITSKVKARFVDAPQVQSGARQGRDRERRGLPDGHREARRKRTTRPRSRARRAASSASCGCSNTRIEPHARHGAAAPFETKICPPGELDRRVTAAPPPAGIHQRRFRHPPSRPRDLPRAGARARREPASSRSTPMRRCAASAKATTGRSIRSPTALAVVAALEAVSLVTWFDEDTPLALIRARQARRAGERRRLEARRRSSAPRRCRAGAARCTRYRSCTSARRRRCSRDPRQDAGDEVTVVT